MLLAATGDVFRLGSAPAEQAEGGQPLHDVEEVPGEAAEQSPLAARRRLGGHADQPPEERDQRKGGDEDDGGDAVGAGHPGEDGQGHERAQHELRQVAGEVGVQGIDPTGGGQRQLAGLLGSGVAASTRPDPQAKGLGEYLRSRFADIPVELLKPR